MRRARHKPTLSVVIATRDRQEYLLETLRALALHVRACDAEVIVHDNSVAALANEVLDEHSEGLNVNYFHVTRRLSQSENYEAGCAKATGEYLTIIGDDDGIASGVNELLVQMQSSGVKAAFSGHALYYWPGVRQRLGGLGSRDTGTLILPSAFGPSCVTDSSSAISACFSRGCTSLEGLPRLYYGIVHSDLIEAVRRRCGRLFPGPSPDMASSVALACVTDEMLVGGSPVFVAGNAPRSAAALGLQGRHEGSLENHPWLPVDVLRGWDNRIPEFWSGPTIWAASAWEAAQAMGYCGGEYPEPNFGRLYAHCLAFSSGSFRSVSRAWQHHASGADALARASLVLTMVGALSGILVDRAARFIGNRLPFGWGDGSMHTVLEDVATVGDACKELSQYVMSFQSHNQPWRGVS